VRLSSDDAILALDKPAGVSMATSEAAGRTEADVVARLLAACGEPAGQRLFLVHRLDVGTSGVVLLARTEAAHRSLSLAFQSRQVRKTYRALVWGAPEPASGAYDDGLGRDPKDGRRRAPRPGGKPALTRYRTLARLDGLTDLALEPETGRTHQLRVHLAARGHPIAGDDLYGNAARWESVATPAVRRALAQLTRPLLHAERLAIAGMGIDVEAPLPVEYVRLLGLARPV